MLNKKQFSLWTAHADSIGSTSSMSDYHLARPHEPANPYDSPQHDVYGHVSVTHNTAAVDQYTTWNGRDQMSEENFDPKNFLTRSRPLGQAERGQQELFRERYAAGRNANKSVVDYVQFDERAKPMILATLAVAARDTALTHGGRSLTPSADRSEHSENLVNRLAERGAVEHSERAGRNSMTWRPAYTEEEWAMGDERPPEVLEKGRRTARSMVRMTRPRKAHFDEQQRLFE